MHYYISAGSTVNICALDVRKAFDKMNHYGLFIKLMLYQPVNSIETLVFHVYNVLSDVTFGLAGTICIAVFVNVASYLLILIVWLIKCSLVVSVVTLSIHVSVFYYMQTIFYS